MSKPFLLFQGPISTRSGYGEHSRDLLHSLIEMDRYEIKVVSMRWGSTPMNALNDENEKDMKIISRILKDPLQRKPDVFVQVSIPNEFQPVGNYNIGVTAGIETTKCAPTWIEGINRMDLTIVPSKHSKTVFDEASFTKLHPQTRQPIELVELKKPIEILFEGVDTDVFTWKSKDGMIDTVDKELSGVEEDFNFLYVGHWIQGELGEDRKNVGMLVKTFYTVFNNMPNAPGLILKTNAADFSVIDREEILHKIKSIKESFENTSGLPNVYLLHGDLTEEEMNGLYNHSKVKVHVSFTKGEGFGRPLLEAVMSGKPIIATAWSGHLDFLDEMLSVLLPGEMKPVHPSAVNDWIIKESEWFNVDYSASAIKLNDIFANYDNYTDNAKKLAAKNKKDFSLKKMNKEFLKILDKYVKTPEQVAIKLPKLSSVKKGNKPKIVTSTGDSDG